MTRYFPKLQKAIWLRICYPHLHKNHSKWNGNAIIKSKQFVCQHILKYNQKFNGIKQLPIIIFIYHTRIWKRVCKSVCILLSCFSKDQLPYNETYFFNFFISLERGEGREKKRERYINVWLPLTHPILGTWPASQACALTGFELVTLWFTGPCSIHWATPARARRCFLTSEI